MTPAYPSGLATSSGEARCSAIYATASGSTPSIIQASSGICWPTVLTIGAAGESSTLPNPGPMDGGFSHVGLGTWRQAWLPAAGQVDQARRPRDVPDLFRPDAQ